MLDCCLKYHATPKILQRVSCAISGVLQINDLDQEMGFLTQDALSSLLNNNNSNASKQKFTYFHISYFHISYSDPTMLFFDFDRYFSTEFKIITSYLYYFLKPKSPLKVNANANVN